MRGARARSGARSAAMARVYVHLEEEDVAAVFDVDAAEGAAAVAERFRERMRERGVAPAAMRGPLALRTAGGEAIDAADSVAAAVGDRGDVFVVVGDDAGGDAVGTTAGGEHAEQAPAPAGTAGGGGGGRGDTADDSLLKHAQDAFQDRRFAEAKALYESVLQQDPRAFVAHVALVSCELAAGKHAAAAKRAAKSQKLFSKDGYLKLLLGDALAGQEEWELAIDEYDAALRVVTRGGDAAASMDALSTTAHDVRIKRARAMFHAGDETEACDEIMAVLQETDQSHPAALLEYSRVCVARGRDVDAVQVLLRLVVRNAADKEVRRELAAAVRRAGVQALLDEVGEKGTKSASAIAFLATVMKENGALDECLELYRLANSLEPGPSGATYALNLFHALEVANRCREALVSIARAFFTRNASVAWFGAAARLLEGLESAPEFGAGGLLKGRRGSGGERWRDAAFEQSTGDAAADADAEIGGAPLTVGSDEELNALALLFATVKVLYLVSAKRRAAALAAVASRAAGVQRPQPLHETLIRNEAAYFNCVAQLLETAPPPDLPMQGAAAHARKPLYVLGDSHCLPLAWRVLALRGEERVCVPMLVTGLKQWHLRQECLFYTKEHFDRVASTVPDGADVLALFGEIDCREGLATAVERGLYVDTAAAAAEVAKIYLRTLGALSMARKLNVFVHDVPPVLDPTRENVRVLNQALANTVAKAAAGKASGSLTFVPAAQSMLGEDGKLRPDLDFDATHLHPRYVESDLQRALDAATAA